jgi:hypothetical protein
MKNTDLLLTSYVKHIMSKAIDDMGKYKKESRDFTKNVEDAFNKFSAKYEYNDYIRYLLSDSFGKKHDEFERQIANMISDRFPKQNNTFFYTYAVLGVMFVLQIIILIR